MDKKPLINAEEFRKRHLEGCRKGGLKSAGVRKEKSRRYLIELAILDKQVKGTYTHSSASKIAGSFDASAHYVRKVSRELKNKRAKH